MENASFWESLTTSLIGSGQKFFSNQQTINANLTSQQILTNTISSVVKFVAIVFVVGGILRAIFTRRK